MASNSPFPSSQTVDDGDLLDFVCPRCRQSTSHRFYGPCPACVQQLRETVRNDAVDVIAPEYEPKMNVTPNAVALKE